MPCKNAFGAKMHLVQKCIFARQRTSKAIALHPCFLFYKKHGTIFLQEKEQNVMPCVAKMHLVQKCIFATQRTHFVLQNVRKNVFLRLFCRTKCSATQQHTIACVFIVFCVVFLTLVFFIL